MNCSQLIRVGASRGVWTASTKGGSPAAAANAGCGSGSGFGGSGDPNADSGTIGGGATTGGGATGGTASGFGVTGGTKGRVAPSVSAIVSAGDFAGSG